jgi:hypothetical protein
MWASGSISRILICAALTTIVGAIGCSKSDDTVSVSGHVTYRGEDLTNGSITFFPAIGRPVNEPIRDGKYNAELLPGDYIVTVSYTEPLPAGYKEGDPIPAPKFVLPPEYTARTRSKLSAAITKQSDAQLDFKLH